jgi:hypothetical protein
MMTARTQENKMAQRDWFYSEFSGEEMDYLLQQMQGWAPAGLGRSALAAALEQIVPLTQWEKMSKYEQAAYWHSPDF